MIAKDDISEGIDLDLSPSTENSERYVRLLNTDVRRKDDTKNCWNE